MRRIYRSIARDLCLSLATLIAGACATWAAETDILDVVWPIRQFTISNGLAHNNIRQIFQDTKGYIWIATNEGLSRYDGYGFKTYGPDDGLGIAFINDVTADKFGRIWVAVSEGGVAMLVDDPLGWNDGGSKKFVTYSVSPDRLKDNVNRIIFDQENRLWCATEGGVMRSRSLAVTNNDFDLVATDRVASPVRNVFSDSQGRTWFGGRDSIIRITNGKTERIEIEASEPIVGITERRDGRIIAATRSGVYEFADHDRRWHRLNVIIAKNQSINTIKIADDDGLLIGTTQGLIHYLNETQRTYGTRNGLSSDSITAIYHDRENSLWLGTVGGGVSNRTNKAIVRYMTRGGSPAANAFRITPDRVGNVYIQVDCHIARLVKISDDQASQFVAPNLSGSDCLRGNFFQASDGRWWYRSEGQMQITASGESFPNVGTTSSPVGPPLKRESGIYQDNDGNVWVSGADNNLYLADAGQNGLPEFRVVAEGITANRMLRDSRGILWLVNNAYLGRYKDGRLEAVANTESDTTLQPRSIFEDSKGRVWIGTRYEGVLMTDEPDAEQPRFQKITTADGLASSSVWAITEDKYGTIYFGTGRGVDRYHPDRRTFRHFTTVDGISESVVNYLLTDLKGRVWVAADGGVSRIEPEKLDSDPRRPTVFYNRVVVAGRELPLAESGLSDISLGKLAPDENNIWVSFVAPGVTGNNALTYQYKLEGGDQDWSSTHGQREVNLVNLGPGSYRFLVRAIDGYGQLSESPAVFAFQILPPVWQRWWFISLVGVVVAAALYLLYRYRLANAVALERVRTRIATDLHDDIGSNLTRIALMSEVLNQQEANGAMKTMLPSIANIAHESVASMNDIVWAISPEHDRVMDLTRRMRQHAEEIFTTRDIELSFVSQAVDSELKLEVGVRRDVLLIFKEAVNNAARHSGCTRIAVEFECSGSALKLRISDNGHGFSQDSEYEGHGLRSMTRRAKGLNGTLNIDSHEGVGTTVDLVMTIGKR